MRWINSLAKQHEKHYVIAFIVVMVILLFYSEIEPDRYERRVIALELPPCCAAAPELDTYGEVATNGNLRVFGTADCVPCTRPQLRVWTVGNASPLIKPRPLGPGPFPHID